MFTTRDKTAAVYPASGAGKWLLADVQEWEANLLHKRCALVHPVE